MLLHYLNTVQPDELATPDANKALQDSVPPKDSRESDSVHTVSGAAPSGGHW
jgi:hypothetical protein